MGGRSKTTVLFEPWSLGDALIAAWAIRWLNRSGKIALSLACASHYHELISQIYPEIPLIGIDLPYTGSHKARLLQQIQSIKESSIQADSVVSIRGDIRDYMAARRVFPSAKRSFRGWRMFMARRSLLLDFPYKAGILPIRNRYWQWVRLLGGDQSQLPYLYPAKSGSLKIGIHTGAQWQRKRYPYVLELSELLKANGHVVHIFSGPGDPPFLGVDHNFVISGKQAIIELQACDLILTNDSGPMHLAAAISKPTVGIFANTGAREWTPPTALALGSVDLPGYRLKFNQSTHDPLPDPKSWIAPDQIVSELVRLGWLKK